MAWAKYFLFFTIISLISNPSSCAEEGLGAIVQIGIGGTSIVGTNYINNVNSLLSVLISESSAGFFNASAGDDSGRAYGWFLCRGDLSAERCDNCLHRVRDFIVRQPISNYHPNAIVSSSNLECVIRYANSSTALVYRRNTTHTVQGFGDRLSQHRQYNTTLLFTMQDVVRLISSGILTNPYFFTTEVGVTGTSDRIFMLSQCTPDISRMNCSDCLHDLYTTFPPTSMGGNILGSNCLLTYNNEPFFGNGYHKFIPSYLHLILVLLLAMYFTFV
ncbi:putative cysteine-rich repeat secretory protein 5 [Beta vulgaris subsp. vulgaris]|uniref:putative cysteine-rich repeat secretory protein 5 n=1 Tax=Beta vulgaris subsp. vulgaris TaxID=3555 RepID=UPI002036D793|nr:putative cysteine-rich repeat secretory protein 5 [Beta vulgaris subsp. vulgaris]